MDRNDREQAERAAQRRSRALDAVSTAATELFALLGLRKGAGRIWALLYLDGQTLDADTLRRDLGISSGAASMGLNDLMALGLVRRVGKPGERRMYYRAESELWPALTRIFKEKERSRIAQLLDAIKESRDELASEGARADEVDTIGLQQRLSHLAEVGDFVLDLLDAFTERTRVEMKAVQKWLSVSGKLGGEPLSRLRRRINAVRDPKDV